MEYIVIIHRAEEGGYWLEVPLLPGCFAQGETLEDILDNARGAIASHVEALGEDGNGRHAGDTMIASVAVG